MPRRRSKSKSKRKRVHSRSKKRVKRSRTKSKTKRSKKRSKKRSRKRTKKRTNVTKTTQRQKMIDSLLRRIRGPSNNDNVIWAAGKDPNRISEKERRKILFGKK